MADENEKRGAPQIRINEAQMAGVWANLARVAHSPYEFTIDFVRLDFSQNPPSGLVVSRVSLSPLLISQLIEALQKNWERYADKAMPPEVRNNANEDRSAPQGDDDASAQD